MSPPTSPDEHALADASNALAAAVVEPPAVPRTPQQVCAHHGSAFQPPEPHDRVAVALDTLHLVPLNLRRVTPEAGQCGWYVWGGEGRTGGAGFFQPLTVAKLLERCPQLLPYLALAPGWQVQGRSDVWHVMPPHAVVKDRGVAVAFVAPGPYRARARPVTRYFALSILLHLLAISLLGDTGGDRNTSGGGRAKPAGGAFSVSLQGPQALPAAPAVATSSAARSEPRRRSRKAASAKTAPEPVAPTVAPAEVPVETAAAAAPASEPLVSAEPLMPALISTPVDKAVTEFVVPQVSADQPSPPASRPIEPLPTLEALTTPKIRQEVAVPAELLPRLAPLTAPTLAPSIAVPAELIPRLAPIAPVRIERDSAVPAELIPRLAPIAPPASVRDTAVPAELVQRLAPIEPPRVNQDAAVPAELVPRLAPLATPTINREIAVPAELVPRLSPLAPSPVLDRVPATTFAPPVVSATPAAGDAARATPPPLASERPRDDAGAAARASPAPGGRDPAGSTAAESDIFSRRGAGPPGAAGSGEAAPRIDLDQVRRRARELASESAGPRTLLPFPTVKPPEDTRSKTQQAFDKALKRPDCRDVYAAMGLAAVVPLVLDAVTEKGCKW